MLIYEEVAQEQGYHPCFNISLAKREPAVVLAGSCWWRRVQAMDLMCWALSTCWNAILNPGRFKLVFKIKIYLAFYELKKKKKTPKSPPQKALRIQRKKKDKTRFIIILTAAYSFKLVDTSEGCLRGKTISRLLSWCKYFLWIIFCDSAARSLIYSNFQLVGVICTLLYIYKFLWISRAFPSFATAFQASRKSSFSSRTP